MPAQKVKTIEVKGKSFDVTLSPGGEFETVYQGEVVTAESLKKLTSTLTTRLSREKRVNIAIVYWDKDSWNHKPGRLRTGAILGIHGGNNNLLVKWQGEKGSEQFAGSSGFFDPKHANELNRLGEALDKAQKAFDDFKDKHSINVREQVSQLLGETDAG